ncbi:MAG TPA: hypothetical protein VL329_03775 [Nitrospiraceae bacterium]|jgi:hypothetical protein|nr:hypothetical protein [Nitrospiraceae bacterium]
MNSFTAVHTGISLIAIVSGLVVMLGMLTRRRLDRWTAVFITLTLATSVSGFFLPLNGLTPAVIVAILSLIVLGLAILARYTFRLQGAWRWIYVACASIALYFNVFVLVVQLFQKVPALKALAPTQSEPPFAFTQVVVLLLFIVLAVAALYRFRPVKGLTA